MSRIPTITKGHAKELAYAYGAFMRDMIMMRASRRPADANAVKTALTRLRNQQQACGVVVANTEMLDLYEREANQVLEG